MIPGCQLLYRRNRNRREGGVVVYLKKHLDHIWRADLEASETEIMWLELLLRNNKHAFLAVCCQPPDIYNDKKLKFIDSLESSINKIISIIPSAIILTGDFNDNLTNSGNSANHLSLLFKAFQNYNFSHLICKPTRGNKTLDWIVTDEPNKVVSSSIFLLVAILITK